jgi:hypothetical protein
MLKTFKTKAEILKESQLKVQAILAGGRRAYSLDVAKAQIKHQQEEKALRTGKAKRAARRAEHEAREGAETA